ncbi:MAG: OB-fold nucleic acid binding domain-containing protein, partial [Candidatus Eisenbacteria bacterium]
MTGIGTTGASVRLEDLGDWRRTHTCGELTRAGASAHVRMTATLMGWVHRVRDHGGVLFVDLRDRYGITQVVFRPEVCGPEVMARAGEIGSEWVIAARGAVALRPRESVNPEMPTGEVELEAREIRILAAAAPLPFQVNEEMHLANEDLR